MTLDLQGSPDHIPGLPVRAANVIANADIRTIAKLIDRPFSDLTRLKGMSHSLAQKVRQALAEEGITFKNDRLRASGGDPLTVFHAVLNLNLTEINLGLRGALIVERLQAANIYSVADLLLLSREDVGRIRNIGPMSVQVIAEGLGRLGLMLRQPAVVEAVEPAPAVVGSKGLLVDELALTWDPDKAKVLADWCEEQEMYVLAGELRKGPSCTSRTLLEAFASMFQEPLRFVSFRSEWKAGWHDEPREAEARKAFEEAKEAVRRSFDLDQPGRRRDL